MSKTEKLETQNNIELSRGAEGIIYDHGDKILKTRTEKKYRHPELDVELRKSRTRREAKLLQKLTIPHPKLINTDDKENIVMEKIDGIKLRDTLDKDPSLAKKVGEITADLHNSGIVHGDLTTSNIMINKKKEIIFIDFGLSFQTIKIEDKAVDIHLFKQALESKHFTVFEKALQYFLKGYKKAKDYNEILERLNEVEKRGRYRKG